MEKDQKKHIVKSEEMVEYAKYRAAQWLHRLLDANMVAPTFPFFQCVHWLIDDLRPIVKNVVKLLRSDDEKGLSAESLKERDQAFKILRTMWREWPNHNIARNFDDVVSDNPCILEPLRESIMEALGTFLQGPASQLTLYDKAKRDMKKFFSLNQPSLELCELTYLLQTNSHMEEYFENKLEVWDRNQREVLACILDTNAASLDERIAELESCGVIVSNGPFDSYYRFGTIAKSLWGVASRYNTDHFFCTLLDGETLPLEKFRVEREELDYVKGLLTAKGDEPVHILIWGPPGTGKTSFCRSLIKELKINAWSVNSRAKDTDGDRRASLTACLNIARRKKGGVTVVDECERLLHTSFDGGDHGKGKEWLNSLMEKPGNRVIWIANHVGHVDPAVRRRFSFSIKFQPLSKKERQEMWTDVLDRHEAKDFFTEHQIKALADKHPVSVAVMDKAVSQAKRLGYGQEDFSRAVECSLRAYSRLTNNNDEKSTKSMTEVEVFQDFTPDGITLDGSLDDLMARFRRADALMRENKRPLPGGCASLLFWGPSGTGKTALARYIAHELDRKCVVQRASDLLNKYVGESEKLISSAFRSAEEEGAVLVFDEADSFLFARETGQMSWEVSMVNEFLTRLEECRCFCVCTTNRFKDLDPAAIRRFAYKVPFTYAKPSQAIALYNALLQPLCDSPLPEDLEKELRSLTHLTPGDFRTVCSQYGSLFAEEPFVEHKTLIDALRKEESLKSKFIDRKAGF